MAIFRGPRAQPTAPVPACHADAAALLATLGITCDRVIRVDPDSVLYLTPNKEARTLWLRRTPQEHLQHHVEAGFQACLQSWPSSWLTSPSSVAP